MSNTTTSNISLEDFLRRIVEHEEVDDLVNIAWEFIDGHLAVENISINDFKDGRLKTPQKGVVKERMDYQAAEAEKVSGGKALTLEERVAKAEAEILQDMKIGAVSRDIACFEDLHEFVDANQYLLADDEVFDTKNQELVEEMNAAIDMIDTWLIIEMPEKLLELENKTLPAGPATSKLELTPSPNAPHGFMLSVAIPEMNAPVTYHYRQTIPQGSYLNQTSLYGSSADIQVLADYTEHLLMTGSNLPSETIGNCVNDRNDIVATFCDYLAYNQGDEAGFAQYFESKITRPHKRLDNGAFDISATPSINSLKAFDNLNQGAHSGLTHRSIKGMEP